MSNQDPQKLTPAERDALALSYVLCRASGAVKRGGALEGWAREADGGNLDRLAGMLACLAGQRFSAAAATLADIRFDDPALTRQVRGLAAQLDVSRDRRPGAGGI